MQILLKTTLFFAVFGLVACAGGKGAVDICAPTALLPDTSNADVLIIGDSISIGYTPYVAQSLVEFDVDHNACNAKSTRNGLVHIDSWLNQRESYSLITFNFGLHDLSNINDVSIPEYKDNLRIIAQKIQAKSERVIFFTTTHISLGVEEGNAGEEDVYNQAAVEVMVELGITVYDLGGLSKTITEHHVSDTDFHWTAQGSQILGQFVADSIRNEMEIL